MERSLSILLPAQNAQASLGDAVLELLEVGAELTSRLEIMIVDDGSRDETVDAAVDLALCFPQVGVARHPIPLGREAALRTALERTAGEIVFVRDAGWRLNLHDLGKMWRKMDQHELIVGWPISEARPALPRPRVPWRTWGTEVLTGPSGCDLADAFQMIRRDAAVRLGWPRIEGLSLLAALPTAGYDWAQVEIRDLSRSAASQTASPASAGLRRAPLRPVRAAVHGE